MKYLSLNSDTSGKYQIAYREYESCIECFKEYDKDLIHPAVEDIYELFKLLSRSALSGIKRRADDLHFFDIIEEKSRKVCKSKASSDIQIMNACFIVDYLIPFFAGTIEKTAFRTAINNYKASYIDFIATNHPEMMMSDEHIQYIFEFEYLRYRTRETRLYYYHFKNQFFKGTPLPLSTIVDYAFYLMFDLITMHTEGYTDDEYEKSLIKLAQTYPITAKYVKRQLPKTLCKYAYESSTSWLSSMETICDNLRKSINIDEFNNSVEIIITDNKKNTELPSIYFYAADAIANYDINKAVDYYVIGAAINGAEGLVTKTALEKILSTSGGRSGLKKKIEEYIGCNPWIMERRACLNYLENN